MTEQPSNSTRNQTAPACGQTDEITEEVATAATPRPDEEPHASEDPKTNSITNYEGDRPAARREMSAQEALDRLRRGEALDGVTISNLEFRGEFALPIKITHATLLAPVFHKAIFHEPVTLCGCTLKKLTVRKKTTFERGLCLDGSVLVACNLRDVQVQERFTARGLETQGDFTVQRAYLPLVSFWDAHFNGWVNFRECTFHDQADLRNFNATEGVTFEKCVFEGELLLRGATVEKKLSFTNSRLEGCVDLSKAKLHDFVYLEEIEQGARQQFRFVNAIVDRILIRPHQLRGRLASENENNFPVAMQEYALLKSVFGILHRYDEEDWAYYQFKVCQRRAKPRSWWRPWTKLTQLADWLLLDHGCGYGTNPMRAVRTAALLIALFGVIYMVGIDMFRVENALIGDRIDAWPNRIFFGLLTSISVFTAGFTGDRLYAAREWMLVPLAIEALLGTLLWGFFIVAFSRKVIR